MGWIGVVDDHVFRLASLGKIKDFLMAGMCGERKLFQFQVDVDVVAVNLNFSRIEKTPSSGVSCLIPREEHSILCIVAKAVEVPNRWSPVEHS